MLLRQARPNHTVPLFLLPDCSYSLVTNTGRLVGLFRLARRTLISQIKSGQLFWITGIFLIIGWSFPQKWFLAPLLLWALTADKKIPGLGRNAFLCVWDPSFIAARSLIDDSRHQAWQSITITINFSWDAGEI